MSEPVAFGRRRTPLRTAPVPAPPGAAAPNMLTPEAEAFRAKLAASRSSSSSFEAWIQSQRGRQLATWLITLAFLSPGLLCFVFGAPSSVSFGLELAGFAINAWLRRERRRRRAEILAWTEPDAGESEDAPGFATGAAQPF